MAERDETIRLNFDATGDDKIARVQGAIQGVIDAEGVATAAHEKEEISLDALAEKYTILSQGIELFKQLALTVGGLVAFEKVKEEIGAVLETGDKFERWGIQFKNAFGGAEAGAEAFEKIKTLAEAAPYSLDVVTDAAIKMKRQGLDPLDGSLQTLIDTNAKYGGSTDQLSGLIDAFSKAAAKGELSTRLLITLQQQGVPAAKLLGDAMGVTADQINEMAKKGELGRTSIALLLQKLGEANSGGAATAMATLSSQVTKLHDQWDEFLELIAKSGVYDFAKDELRQVGEAIQKGLGDGSLKEKAQAISDAIVGIGRAALSVVQFLSEHAEAVKNVAEAYALLKAGSIAGDILKLGLSAAESAANMIKFGGAAGDAAAATGKLSTEAAAARGGLVNIALALAAFDAVKIFEVADALRETRRVAQQEQESLKDAADTQKDLFQRSIEVVNQTRDSANVAIKSAQELKAQSQEQSAAYVQQLNDAIRHYTALRVQARELGNDDDVRKYTAKLRELTVGLQDAATAHAKVTEAVKTASEAVVGAVNNFERLKTSGASSAEAVQGAFDKLEIKTPEGLSQITDKLSAIDSASSDAGKAIESELVGALEKLNVTDLAEFQRSVTKALADGKGNAEALTQELQAGLEAELIKLGVNAEESGLKFTKAGQQIITEFRAISENAQVSGKQIGEAFEQALSKVKTSGEVDALRTQLKAAFEQGKISAQEFAQASEEAANALLKIKNAADPVEQALQRLHVTSQSALTATANDAKIAFEQVKAGSDGSAQAIANEQNAFLKYAQARLAAAAQLGPSAQAQAKAELDTEAATLELSGAMATLEVQSSKTGNALLDAAKKAEEAATHERIAREEAGAAAFNAGVQADLAGKQAAAATDKAEKGFTEWGDAADAAALKTKGITADASHANEAMDKLRDGIKAAQEEFARTSAAAKQLFDTDLQSLFQLGHSDNLSGIDRAFQALADAAQVVHEHIAADRVELQGMVDNINAVGTASDKGFGAFGSNASDAGARIGQMIDAIKSGNYQVGILGQQDLQPLLQALEQAKQRAEAAGQAAAQAAGQFNALAQSIHDQLLQEQGDQKALEDERHQRTLDNLKQEADAGKIDSGQYQKAVNDENALHDLKMQHLQQQQSQQQAGGGSGSGSGSNAGGGTSKPTVSGGTASGGGSLGSLDLNHTINFKLPNQPGQMTLGDLVKNASQSDIESLGALIGAHAAQEITYQVTQELTRAKARAGL